MPSLTHESLVDLFRDCPALALQLLGRADAGIPALARGFENLTPRLTAAEFADTKAHEFRADAVIRLDDGHERATDVLIVEVQLERDGNKRLSWPFYMASARLRHRCPATVVVIATDPGVAAWCAHPIELDRNGCVMTPVVLGPDRIPRITDIDQAREAPEVAILSAAMHGREPDAAEIAIAGLSACNALDNERSTRYADLILSTLGPVARQVLEKLMSARNYEYQSDFARKYVAEGVEKGREQERRAIVLRYLTRRFAPLPPEALQRVKEADADTLEIWADRLLFAESLEDVWSD